VWTVYVFVKTGIWLKQVNKR